MARIPGFDSALVRMEPNGKVIAWVSHTTQGQGHLTAFAQIVAELIGVRVEDVTVAEGDTAMAPYGTGTFASRGVVTGGGAVLRASTRVAEKLRRLAGQRLEAAAADIELKDGHAFVTGVPQMRISIPELARYGYSMTRHELPPGETFGLEATDYYDPPRASLSNATHIAQVAIDPVTGELDVERYVVVHDCGRVVNPAIVDGQIHGGVMQGLGSVLYETVRHDDQGQPLQASLLDYMLPTIADAPMIEIHHEETWSTETEGGFKGVGEGGTIGAVPALTGAIADALRGAGAVVNRIPLHPASILELLLDGKKR
jgi:carbon-monoxide dehydrogenase large subunit